MENLDIIIYICFLIPMILSLFIMEKKSRLIVEFILIGLTVCLIIGYVNTYLYNLIGKDMVYYCTTISPIAEELIKAIPILIFALCITDDRQKIVQCAFAVGLGFAIMENIYMLTQNVSYYSSNIDIPWAIIRGLGAGLMHSICTATVGIGISFVKKKKKLFYTGTLALLMLAITYHAIYNSLVMSNFQYLGIILPINTYIPLIFFYKKQQNNN